MYIEHTKWCLDNFIWNIQRENTCTCTCIVKFYSIISNFSLVFYTDYYIFLKWHHKNQNDLFFRVLGRHNLGTPTASCWSIIKVTLYSKYKSRKANEEHQILGLTCCYFYETLWQIQTTLATLLEFI